MRIFCRIMSALSAIAFITCHCFADVVFRGEGTVELSLTDSLFSEQVKALTVMSVPNSDQGSLFCQGAKVEAFDRIDRSELDSLVFVPYCEEVFCRIELLPDGCDSGITVTVTDSDSEIASASVEAGLYCWAWAKSGYFSHIRKTLMPPLL